jgi:hypothetical protein
MKYKLKNNRTLKKEHVYALTSVSGCCYLYTEGLDVFGWIPITEHPPICKLRTALTYDEAKDEFFFATPYYNDSSSYSPTTTPILSSIYSSKKETMLTQILKTNKEAATQAAVLETGRIANATLATIIAKKFPMLPDTPFNDLIVANLASVIVTQVKPSPKLKKVTDAMVIQAYQSVYQLIDIEGMIAELMSALPGLTDAE